MKAALYCFKQCHWSYFLVLQTDVRIGQEQKAVVRLWTEPQNTQETFGILPGQKYYGYVKKGA